MTGLEILATVDQGKTLAEVAGKLRRITDPNAEIACDFEQQKEDILLELGPRVDALEDILGGRVTATEREVADAKSALRLLQARVDDADEKRLFRNWSFEAAREPNEGRRAMLVAAAASSLLSSLPLGTRARIERVLRELDPDDVRWLAIVGGVPDGQSTPEEVRPADIERHNILVRCGHRDELIAAGCVRSERVGFDGLARVRVTHRGRLVIQVLASWLSTQSRPTWPTPPPGEVLGLQEAALQRLAVHPHEERFRPVRQLLQQLTDREVRTLQTTLEAIEAFARLHGLSSATLVAIVGDPAADELDVLGYPDQTFPRFKRPVPDVFGLIEKMRASAVFAPPGSTAFAVGQASEILQILGTSPSLEEDTHQ